MFSSLSEIEVLKKSDNFIRNVPASSGDFLISDFKVFKELNKK